MHVGGRDKNNYFLILFLRLDLDGERRVEISVPFDAFVDKCYNTKFNYYPVRTEPHFVYCSSKSLK